MKAVVISSYDGPDALEVRDVEGPSASHPLTPGRGVVIEVRAAGVSFPELLQTRGLYQLQPDLPFVPGHEVAGVVVDAPQGSGFVAGDRVMALTSIGGLAEVAVAPEFLTYGMPDGMTWEEGASIILNYHTAYFSLAMRGRLVAGERVLVHGAAGGVGTATIQVARGLGAHVIAVVSSDAKAQVARDAGAHDVVMLSDRWRSEVQALGGADIVVDPVGGDRVVDSLRCLREGGRLVVVGFTAGIPEIKANRLLLNNLEVVGAGWGAFVMGKPAACREIGEQVLRMYAEGHVRPVIGAVVGLADAADAFRLIDRREATGKVIVTVGQR